MRYAIVNNWRDRHDDSANLKGGVMSDIPKFRHRVPAVLAVASALGIAPARAAQVQSMAQIEINAPADRVWRLLTRIDGWPKWNPAVDSSVLQGPLGKGSIFVWKSKGFTVTSTLQDVEPLRRLSWTGAAFGTRAFHSWDLRELDGQVVVSTFESFDGWVPCLFSRAMQKTLDDTLPAWLQALKTAAERGT